MGLVWEGANTLPNEYMLASSKLKAFAGNKRNAAEMIISVLDTVENIVGKEENAGYQHFLLFPQSFQKASFSGLLKSGLCDEELRLLKPRHLFTKNCEKHSYFIKKFLNMKVTQVLIG